MGQDATTGSCLCGNVRFRVHGEIAPIQICHCSQCRKAQGSAFASNTPVAASALEWLSGRESLTEYESSPGKKRAFCSRCGSPVYSRRDEIPEVLRLRAGLLDEPLQARPAAHFCVDSKAAWYRIDDGLPQHPGVYVPPPK